MDIRYQIGCFNVKKNIKSVLFISWVGLWILKWSEKLAEWTLVPNPNKKLQNATSVLKADAINQVFHIYM